MRPDSEWDKLSKSLTVWLTGHSSFLHLLGVKNFAERGDLLPIRHLGASRDPPRTVK
jgi:hypothetical protein